MGKALADIVSWANKVEFLALHILRDMPCLIKIYHLKVTLADLGFMSV